MRDLNMKRPGWITLFSFLFVLTGSVTAMLFLRTVSAILRQPHFAHGSFTEATLLIGFIVALGCLPAAHFAIAVGLWKMKEWSRKGALLLLGIAIGYQLINFYPKLAATKRLDGIHAHQAAVVLVGDTFMALAVQLLCIGYLRDKAVRVLFQG